jgi:hypothetical protein
MTITCLEFRRRVGAEPAAADAALEEHRRGCDACARYQDEMRAMDETIRRALRIQPPPREAAPAARVPARRQRFFAIAASLLAGVGVAAVLLVGAPRVSVAREVFGHVEGEVAETMKPLAPLSVAEVAEVLGPEGLRLKPGAGDVTFAARCVFDGHVVPHLVVRRPEGAVTVLLLRHRDVGRRMRLAEEGYEGVVLPAPQGSIAVVGEGIADLDAVARRVFDAVDWNAAQGAAG